MRGDEVRPGEFVVGHGPPGGTTWVRGLIISNVKCAVPYDDRTTIGWITAEGELRLDTVYIDDEISVAR